MLAPPAAVTLQDERASPRQLVHLGLEFAERNQTRPVDARDLVFVGFAHVNQRERLGRLDESDDAGQNAQDAGFRAARGRARRWRFREKAAVTGPAQMRRKNARLSFEAENGAVDIWFAREDANVVGKITSRK